MSIQAELAVRLLMRFYIEFDQRSGWTTDAKAVEVFKKEGVSEGRTREAIGILKGFKMLDELRQDDSVKIKISSYGIQWLEKTCPPVSRDPAYEFALPTFRSVKLVGPDEFYGRSKLKPSTESGGPNWTMWGAVAGIAALPLAIFLWWLS